MKAGDTVELFGALWRVERIEVYGEGVRTLVLRRLSDGYVRRVRDWS